MRKKTYTSNTECSNWNLMSGVEQWSFADLLSKYAVRREFEPQEKLLLFYFIEQETPPVYLSTSWFQEQIGALTNLGTHNYFRQ